MDIEGKQVASCRESKEEVMEQQELLEYDSGELKSNDYMQYVLMTDIYDPWTAGSTAVHTRAPLHQYMAPDFHSFF